MGTEQVQKEPHMKSAPKAASPARITPPENRGFRPLVTGLLLGNTGIAMALVIGAWLRETPLFWRNAGGYPILLRDLVRGGFLVLFTADLVFVAGLSLLLIRGLRQRSGPGCLGVAAMGLQWILLLVVAGVALWNNVANWLEGRPWHTHP
jgi:hypothetical protein